MNCTSSVKSNCPDDSAAHTICSPHTSNIHHHHVSSGSSSTSVSVPPPPRSRSPPRRRHRIAIVSDFFYPRLGGVELHQYQIAQGLLKRGHHVIIITGTYHPPPLPHNKRRGRGGGGAGGGGGGGQNNVPSQQQEVTDEANCSEGEGECDEFGRRPCAVRSNGTELRQGIRYMTNGLKVYYCPVMSIHSQASLPLLFTVFPQFRAILLRERIEIVHGHQTTSALAHECMLHARTMGLRVVYTDHSLFGFANTAAIHLNKLMKFTLSDLDHVVCVSHCSKENLVLRAYLNPSMVSVIPNAVDTTKFTPNPSVAPDPHTRITIIILSRLVYRKGVDLVVDVIPPICARFSNVDFVIGGDGNKKLAVEEMVEKHQLQDRVKLLGAVPHDQVRNVLCRGHLFLNCSLTEAFCIAILEAVSCGLFVVSTRVGGVPEILPPHMIRFADPNPADIIRVLSSAIPLCVNVNPFELHAQVKRMYNWHDVAERTERVYDRIIQHRPSSLLERLHKYHECGPWAGKLFCLIVALDYLFWRLLEWLFPASEVDLAIDFPTTYFHKIKHTL